MKLIPTLLAAAAMASGFAATAQEADIRKALAEREVLLGIAPRALPQAEPAPWPGQICR